MDENKEFDLTSNLEVENQKKTNGGKNNISIDESPTLATTEIHSLTEEEENNPNSIIVSITDPSPIVILFGAGQSGKTMTLVRLTRYLRKLGYRVEPDRIFRPSNSKRYKLMCDMFDSSVNSDYAAESTSALNFMLLKVWNKTGEPICQILEAPGEHFFDQKAPKRDFPTYINKICELANRKTWVFIVERDWTEDPSIRKNFADKILSMQSRNAVINDKVIFTCHKADLHEPLFDGGIANKSQFFQDIKNQYPNIFLKYINKNPITRLYRKYNFDFVVFSAGRFNDTSVMLDMN
jgi:hypothetical protein